MNNKATMESAPSCLNTNDKAMWVLGWNECLDAQAAQTTAQTTEQTTECVSVATVLLHEGEKIIDGSMAFMDTAQLGTLLYAVPVETKAVLRLALDALYEADRRLQSAYPPCMEVKSAITKLEKLV